MKTIVTHTNPDWDAIASAWLLKRYLPRLAEAEIKFVNTGNPDLELLASATAVVDTGKKYDPQILHFDHHHLAGVKANETCAAQQVYEHLKAQGLAPDYLKPLVKLVFQGDTGRKTFSVTHSYQTGIHALLSGKKRQYKEQYGGTFMPDEDVLVFSFMLLDALAVQFEAQAQASSEYAGSMVYRSNDGLVVALVHAGVNASYYAIERGAVLVLFLGEPVYNEDNNLLTQAIGVQRAAEWTTPHCGELISRLAKALVADERIKASVVIDELEADVIIDELATWFRHNAGFFAGRGTGKAPVAELVPAEITKNFASFARLFDLAWER